jgi:hypothetical protein
MTRWMNMPVPTAAPLGVEVLPEHAQEVWDAFVKPEQEADTPQSVEMRMLMAILRAFHAGLIVTEDE